MSSLHEHYDQLTGAERDVVDRVFRMFFAEAKQIGLNLNGSDPAEVAVDAVAKWFLQSGAHVPVPLLRGGR